MAKITYYAGVYGNAFDGISSLISFDIGLVLSTGSMWQIPTSMTVL